MPLNAYLSLAGAKQGKIKGSVTQKGREGTILVIEASHDLVMPHDLATGSPTSKRRHAPFFVTKEVDKATPLLYTALAGNETFTEWVLRFWRPSASGAEQQFYTVTLSNARIVGIEFRMPNSRNPETMRFAEYENVAFVYQSITWTIIDGALSATDSWVSTARRRAAKRK